MRQLLLLIALLAMGAGAVINLVAGSGPKWSRWATYGMASAASGVLVAVGALCISGRTVRVDLGNLLDFGQTRLLLDPLAGLFLTLVGGLGLVISLSMLNWPPPSPAGGRALGWAYMLLLAAMTVVVVAADAFTFLFAWEALTVAFYVLVLATRADRAQPGAAWATASVGAWGGASLLVGFSLLSGAAHSFNFGAWARLSGNGVHATAYALIVFGFATKVGLAPFQGWMPRGYPAAPGPARAAMAGLAVNAGFYGLWRFLALLGRPPGWLAVSVLVLGGVTALSGITFAAVQSDLNRGHRLFQHRERRAHHGWLRNGPRRGFGRQRRAHGRRPARRVPPAARARGGQVRLVPGVRQFPPRGRQRPVERSFRHAAHAGLGLGRLRRIRPHVGRAAADDRLCLRMVHVRGLDAAVPPSFSGPSAGDGQRRGARCPHRRRGRLHLRPAVGFRRPRPGSWRKERRRVDMAGRWSLAATAVLCFALAAAAPWTVRYIGRGLGPVVARSVVDGALKSPWVLQPVFSNFSALSPTWLFVVMSIGFLAVTLATVLLSRGRFLSVRRVPAWHSATPGVRPR